MPFVQSCDVSKKNQLTFNVQEKLMVGYYVKDNKSYALCQDGSSIEIDEQYLNIIVHFPLLSNFNAKQKKQLCEQFQKHRKVLTRELVKSLQKSYLIKQVMIKICLKSQCKMGILFIPI